MTRREALKLGAFAGSSLLLPIGFQRFSYAKDAGSPKVRHFQVPLPIPPLLKPVRSDETTDYYEITMRKAPVQILPGLTTEIWGYNGISPGPTIIQRRDRQSVVRFINLIEDASHSSSNHQHSSSTSSALKGPATSVHLHGMASLPPYDGYAEDLINPGFYKDYIYPNNRPATLWFHDHAVHATSFNVYQGLAAMYQVQDDLELSLPIPKTYGVNDIPLILQDKIFSSTGKLIYDDNGQKDLFGDVLLVNGAPWPRMEVEQRKYRFRILNASNSRIYQLALSTGDDFIVIGTDAGLIDAPRQVKNFISAMGERYEVVIDFSKYPIGTRIVLQNQKLPNQIEYDGTEEIMCFDVVRPANDETFIPNTLRPFPIFKESQAVRVREFLYSRKGGEWVINNKVWDINRIDANPGLGDIEIWKLRNNAGGWSHPIHLHLIDCQMLDRNGKPPYAYERGFKDVFYLGPNHEVRVIGLFAPHLGKYMSHCHNTVHEDYDMMNQFEVGKGGIDPLSVPAKPLPAPPL